MPRSFDDDDDATVGMGFSILVTVCTLIGLLFCFRRASRIFPRSLNIPLQMFGQASDANNSRGPIALTDDDLEGATGLDWEDLEAQMQGVEEEQEEMEDMESTRVEESAAKPLKSASKKQVRYEDDDENDAAAQLLKPMSGQKGGRYKYDDGHGESDDEEEEEEGNSSRPYKDDDERDGSEDNVFTSNVWSRSHTDTETTEAATTRTDDTVLEVEEIPQDDPFKLEDADSELE